jgi:hypothetical protein
MPQTPTGRPPAKASKPSTPSAAAGKPLDPLVLEGIRQSLTSGLSAFPASQPQPGSSQSPPTPTGESSAIPMDTDKGSSPVPDPLAFATAEDALDDDEAESSYKELLDWMRYIAQHKEQRARLLDLMTAAAASLRDLTGLEEERQPASYASVAATSAPRQPRQPKKATPAPTTKHIQHAITRYERVSRELPGASRDTLLKVVANSNLKAAPNPIPEAPKPRKRPSCLVKGIRANTIAARLPPGVAIPPSLPAVISSVNGGLKSLNVDGRVTEILQGVRRHITIVFDRVVDDATSQAALRSVFTHFKTKKEDVHILERPTHSILKFTAVPTVAPDGRQVTMEMIAACLQRHPQWKNIEVIDAPRFVYPKTNPAPYCATLQVKVKDTQKASVAKKLLETSVSFIGITRRCQPWTVSPTARQCSTCLKWGHTAYVCRARAPQCNTCAGPHLSAYHRSHVAACEDQDCTHYQIRCANCYDSHEASSVSCPFFKARSSPGQLQKLQKARVERLRRNL